MYITNYISPPRTILKLPVLVIENLEVRRLPFDEFSSLEETTDSLWDDLQEERFETDGILIEDFEFVLNILGMLCSILSSFKLPSSSLVIVGSEERLLI
mmetsp:Transcript_371/g.671  ORF Transcript_371/g.671 Transcript_371/m.671 type:complete len:99 (-) Transcript_371:3956-4252(-)